MAGNANSCRKHNHRPILSKVMVCAVRPVNECEEVFIEMPAELGGETGPRLHQEGYPQAILISLPPSNHERVSPNSGEDPKFGNREEDELACLDLPWSRHGNIDLQYLCWTNKSFIHVSSLWLRHYRCGKRSAQGQVSECEEDPVKGRSYGPQTEADFQKHLSRLFR